MYEFPHTYRQKKIFLPPSGTGVIQKCLCVCPSVCLSVCASPQKSAITFERDVGSARNFLQRPHTWRVIFGRVTRTPGPNGSGPDPEKRGLREIYLLRGFRTGGVVSHLFGKRRTGPTKCWERNFDFLPGPGTNGPGSPGRSGRRQKFWNSDFFHKRDPY